MSLSRSYSGIINVIACDDCSTDNSLEALKSSLELASELNPLLSYQILINECNKGVSASLNHCLSYCAYDYVYIIASDDSVNEKALDTALLFLIKSGADAVINDCKVIDGNNNTLFESCFFQFRKSNKKQLLTTQLANELVFNWNVPGPALIIKREAYAKTGEYDETLRAEDRDFYLRLVSQCNVVFNQEKLANYRVHLQNASRSKLYLENAEKEFANVNYRHAMAFSGLARWYLLTYRIDMVGFLNPLPKLLRKTFKVIYDFKIKVIKK